VTTLQNERGGSDGLRLNKQWPPRLATLQGWAILLREHYYRAKEFVIEMWISDSLDL